jgi:hypothetical protein
MSEFNVGDIVQFHDGSWTVEVVWEGGKIQLESDPSPASEQREKERWIILAINLVFPLMDDEREDENHRLKTTLSHLNGITNNLLLEGLDTGTLMFTNDRNLHLIHGSKPATIPTPTGKVIPLSEETWKSLKDNI